MASETDDFVSAYPPVPEKMDMTDATILSNRLYGKMGRKPHEPHGTNSAAVERGGGAIMTDQEINRAIAEALTAQGFAEELVWGKGIQCGCAAHKVTYLDGEECTFCGHIAVWKPHNFTDPRYLFPALEAYCDQNHIGWMLQRYTNDPTPMAVGRIGTPLIAQDPKPWHALRNAFAAALGVGE